MIPSATPSHASHTPILAAIRQKESTFHCLIVRKEKVPRSMREAHSRSESINLISVIRRNAAEVRWI